MILGTQHPEARPVVISRPTLIVMPASICSRNSAIETEPLQLASPSWAHALWIQHVDHRYLAGVKVDGDEADHGGADVGTFSVRGEQR